MPKEFSQWVAEMAGTIEDASHFIKPCSCGNSVTQKRSIAQTRMLLADFLVKNVHDTDSLSDWLVAFRVGLVGDSGKKDLTYLSLYDLLPVELVRLYYDLEDWTEESIWYVNLRYKINKGEV